MRIDSDPDHIVRPINIQHVLEMCRRAATWEDGSRVTNPSWIRSQHSHSEYENCVCGHRIEYNHVATCVETGKSFIVGSECINTVCDAEGWLINSQCIYCEEIGCLKTKPYCKDCSNKMRKISKQGSTLLGFGSKHKEHSYIYVYNNDKSYCKWLRGLESITVKRMLKFCYWLIWYEKFKDEIARRESR